MMHHMALLNGLIVTKLLNKVMNKWDDDKTFVPVMVFALTIICVYFALFCIKTAIFLYQLI